MVKAKRLGQTGIVRGHIRGIADQKSRKKFGTDIGGNDLVSVLDIPVLADPGDTQAALGKEGQIPGHNTSIPRLGGHAADAAHIIDDGPDRSVIGTYIRDNAHQTASGDHIGIHPYSVRGALVDPEYLEPVAGVLGDDSGPDLLVLLVVLVKLVQIPQPFQLKLPGSETGILLGQCIDLRLQLVILVQS